MEFCDNCGSLLIGKSGEDVKCVNCGAEKKTTKDLSFSKEIESEKKEVFVLDKGDDWNIHPIIEKECPKCKNNKVRYYTKQTRAADEDETEFYRCEKCFHKWRN